MLHIAVAQKGWVVAMVDGWIEGEGEIVGINNIQMIEGGGVGGGWTNIWSVSPSSAIIDWLCPFPRGLSVYFDSLSFPTHPFVKWPFIQEILHVCLGNGIAWNSVCLSTIGRGEVGDLEWMKTKKMECFSHGKEMAQKQRRAGKPNESEIWS